jgi:hypothetical protein
MKHTGTQIRRDVIVPGLVRIKPTVSLSKAAKQRLKWVDYYHSHGRNVRLTCRHYGIAHRTFYRYFIGETLQTLYFEVSCGGFCQYLIIGK